MLTSEIMSWQILLTMPFGGIQTHGSHPGGPGGPGSPFCYQPNTAQLKNVPYGDM